VRQSLERLEAMRFAGEGNLLECAVDAARKRATLGEISSALEKVWGRYEATTRTIAGVYSAESGKRAEFKKARRWLQSLRRPKAVAPAFLSRRWGRMATTAAPR
jgi:methylmalonyl-CoA mutase